MAYDGPFWTFIFTLFKMLFFWQKEVGCVQSVLTQINKEANIVDISEATWIPTTPMALWPRVCIKRSPVDRNLKLELWEKRRSSKLVLFVKLSNHSFRGSHRCPLGEKKPFGKVGTFSPDCPDICHHNFSFLLYDFLFMNFKFIDSIFNYKCVGNVSNII